MRQSPFIITNPLSTLRLIIGSFCSLSRINIKVIERMSYYSATLTRKNILTSTCEIRRLAKLINSKSKRKIRRAFAWFLGRGGRQLLRINICLSSYEKNYVLGDGLASIGFHHALLRPRCYVKLVARMWPRNIRDCFVRISSCISSLYIVHTPIFKLLSNLFEYWSTLCAFVMQIIVCFFLYLYRFFCNSRLS